MAILELACSPMVALVGAHLMRQADPCHACKNCHYCKHCAKEGGKCGVCKGSSDAYRA